MAIPQKIKNRVTIWPSNPFSRYLPKKIENMYSLRCMHCSCYVHSSTIHCVQDMETSKVSFNRGLDKKDVVNIHNGILISHRKDEKMAIYNNVDGPWGYHAKWNNQSEKAKNHMISLICEI